VPALSPRTVATPSELKLSTALGPAYAQGKAGERWAALIRERSAGRVAVRHYPGATLFQREASREFAALREGSAALAVGSTLAWSPDVAELNLIALPWILPSERALDALLDSAVSAELAARLETLGVVVIAWASNGFIEIASKRACARRDFRCSTRRWPSWAQPPRRCAAPMQGSQRSLAAWTPRRRRPAHSAPRMRPPPA
jgi:TRAP-type C4-dicarboxylate transport system substrate-binding protein